MAEVKAEKGCCATCWLKKNHCHRTSTSRRCRKCTTRSGDPSEGDGNHQRLIEPALPCPYSIMWEQLCERALAGSIISLDTQDMESDTWDLVILTSTKREIALSFENHGAFSTWNEVLVASVDEEIGREFAADLQAEDGDTQLIAHAALAGGYGHCLFTTTETSEQISKSVNGESVYLDQIDHNVDANFKCLLFSRFGELVEEVLIAVRLQKTAGMSGNFYSNAYAAAVILYYEIDYFQSSLRHGHLRSLMSTLFPAGILTWLTSIEQELALHIKEGCHRFPSWRSAIHGSMKKFREQRRGETLKVSINLKRYLFPNAMLDEWSKFSPTLTFTDTWPCPDLSDAATLESSLSYTSESYDSSMIGLGLHDPATSESFTEMLTEVPQQSPAVGVDTVGQMSYHFFTEADQGLSSGNDAPMTSMDPKLVSSNWMTYSDPF